MKAAAK